MASKVKVSRDPSRLTQATGAWEEREAARKKEEEEGGGGGGIFSAAAKLQMGARAVPAWRKAA